MKKVKGEERKVKNSSAYSLSFSLSNKGNREGTEVAQVYIRRMDDAEGPIKTLKAFKRITLKAGEKQQVTISLPRQSFEGWDQTRGHHACGSRQISDLRRWFEC